MALSVKKIAVIIGALGLLALGTNLFMSGSSTDSKSAYIDPSDKQLVTDGKQIYIRDCASCHGANLEGEPNWRMRQANGRLPAPPHDATGHTWHHADALLIEITKNGLVPSVTAPEAMSATCQLTARHSAIKTYVRCWLILRALGPSMR